MMSQRNNSAKALRINPADNVAVALTDIAAGEEADVVSEEGNVIRITAVDRIPLAHKIALVEIGAGERIIKYGESIGAATRDIHRGEHVHIANVKSLRAGS